MSDPRQRLNRAFVKSKKAEAQKRMKRLSQECGEYGTYLAMLKNLSNEGWRELLMDDERVKDLTNTLTSDYKAFARRGVVMDRILNRRRTLVPAVPAEIIEDPDEPVADSSTAGPSSTGGPSTTDLSL